MLVAECRECGQVFMGDDGAAVCDGCEAERDALTCVECGTQMLWPAERCGLCTGVELPVEQAA